MNRNIPQIIKDVGFDFSWDEKKVWALDEPVIEMLIEDLTWHFEIPFLIKDGGVYNLKPVDIIEHPEIYMEEYERTMRAEMEYPIDIMENKGRWLILDGLHRLMKASIQRETKVKVRIIPCERISEIEKI